MTLIETLNKRKTALTAEELADLHRRFKECRRNQ
jgi:hypothetical protein